MNNDNVNNNNKNNNNVVLAMLELPTLYKLFFNIIILNIALDIINIQRF